MVFSDFVAANFFKKESRSPRGFLPRPLLRAGETASRIPHPATISPEKRGGVRSGLLLKKGSRKCYNDTTTLSELRKRSDFAGAKIALSIFSKPFLPTAEAVNSQSSPKLKS